MYVINPLDTGRPVHYYTSDKSICHFVILCLSSLFCHFYSTVDSRYLEIEGTLRNSSRYPYFDISDL